MLCQTELTAERALQQARAVEVVHREIEGMQVVRKELDRLLIDEETNAVTSRTTICYRCVKLGQSAAVCRFKNAVTRLKTLNQSHVILHIT